MIDKNDPEIIKKALSHIFWAPITWAPIIPFLGVVSICSLPLWLNSTLLILPIGFVAGHWALYWPRITQVMQGQVMQAQNADKERKMNDLVRLLKGGGMLKESRLLQKAQEVLTAIEAENLKNMASEQSIRIQVVAADILEQMQIKAQKALGEDPEPCLASFQKSLKTMQDSLDLLERQADALKRMEANPEDKLSELQATLASENEIAGHVIQRIEGQPKETQ